MTYKVSRERTRLYEASIEDKAEPIAAAAPVGSDGRTEHRAPDAVGSRQTKALRMTRKYSAIATGAGFLIPTPGFDFFAVSGIQTLMLNRIAKVYSVPFTADLGKAFIATLVGALPSAKGTALKFLPGVGHLIGGVTVGSLAGASTYAVGKVFIQHFETGGTFLTFDPVRVQEYFLAEFRAANRSIKGTL